MDVSEEFTVTLVSSGVSLTSWGEGTSLALVGHPSSHDKLNLALLLDQLRLA